MPQRVLHAMAGQEKALAALPHAPLGRYAGGVVVALDDNAAVGLMPALALLFFSTEDYQHSLRQLPEDERDAAIRKRLAKWSPNAIHEGMDRLYRRQRRCLTLTALALQGAQRASIPADHFEHSMGALHRLVNEGAFGSMTLPGLLVLLMEREALLLSELAAQQAAAAAEIADRTRFNAGVAQALHKLGRPQFVQYPPYVEPERAAWVSPADASLRADVKARQRPAVELRGGLVSTFGMRDLDALAQQGKTVRILYAQARTFLQDFSDYTPAQLLRELAERSKAGPLPFWEDHLNFMRLDTALMRRAAHAAMLAAQPVLAAELAAVMPRENALLMSALGRHPSWLDDQDLVRPAALAQAEAELIDDATFLARLSAAREHEDVHRRYRAFAEFKAMQLKKF